MTEEFKKGDRVRWNSRNGETVGKIEKKLTEPTDIQKHHVNASEENPQYLVKSDKTGKEAAHKPESLEKM
jgi:Hypervirulence associated proteins TUDOR domain